jgi:hypothetical protein
MVNTNYHKSINKMLILKNYFDDVQKRLLLGNNYPEHPGFAIDILRSCEKDVTNIWNIWLVINKATHSTALVMRNRVWQSEAGCEPTDCDKYDYHRQRLMLADLDVSHREMLGASIIATRDVYREMPRRGLALARLIKGSLARYIFPNFWSSA